MCISGFDIGRSQFHLLMALYFLVLMPCVILPCVPGDSIPLTEAFSLFWFLPMIHPNESNIKLWSLSRFLLMNPWCWLLSLQNDDPLGSVV